MVIAVTVYNWIEWNVSGWWVGLFTMTILNNIYIYIYIHTYIKHIQALQGGYTTPYIAKHTWSFIVITSNDLILNEAGK